MLQKKKKKKSHTETHPYGWLQKSLAGAIDTKKYPLITS